MQSAPPWLGGASGRRSGRKLVRVRTCHIPRDAGHPRLGGRMPKFLWQVSYTAQGAEGLRKDGGTARRAVAQKLAEQMGGRVESFYFALGESDAFIIAELPDAT